MLSVPVLYIKCEFSRDKKLPYELARSFSVIHKITADLHAT